jgi:hypothetical protein
MLHEHSLQAFRAMAEQDDQVSRSAVHVGMDAAREGGKIYG